MAEQTSPDNELPELPPEVIASLERATVSLGNALLVAKNQAAEWGDVCYRASPSLLHQEVRWVQQNEPAGPAEPYLVWLEYAGHTAHEQGGMQALYYAFAQPLYESITEPRRLDRNPEYRKDYRGGVTLEVDPDGSFKDFDIQVCSLREEEWLPSFLEEKLRVAGSTQGMQSEVESITRAGLLAADRNLKSLKTLTRLQLATIFHEAFESGRVTAQSCFDEWQATSKHVEGCTRVAGPLLLHYLDGEWHVLFAQRDKDPQKPAPGTFTVPVGKVDAETGQLSLLLRRLEAPHTRRLHELGILLPSDNADGLESVLEAAGRETAEETEYLSYAESVIGRIDDFLAAEGKILISLFISANDNPNFDLYETNELFRYVWVPLERIVQSPEGLVGETVERYIQSKYPSEEVHVIPELRQIGLESFRRICRGALERWVSLI